MNKVLYKLVGFIPIVGPIIQSKNNFFFLKCSPFMEEYFKTNEYAILKKWIDNHPNQMLSPKIAEELLKHSEN